MKTVAQNKKAFFSYQILETFEAGIVLTGSEVKSVRGGHANLGECYATVQNGELFLVNCHISHYPPAAMNNHEPTRTRKLLLHGNQIERLIGKLKEKGLTLVALKIYFKGNRAKVELGLGKGKKFFDKRESIKKRESIRSMDRALKQNK